MLEYDVIGEEACKTLRYSLGELYLNDSRAVNLAMQILFVVHVWDDLIDKDKTVTSSMINKAFRYAIYDIPTNPIMNRELNILWLSCYNQWLAANEMEIKKEQYEKAYMLRAAIYSMFLQIASVVGGLDHAEKISYELFSLYGESFSMYKEEFENA